MKKLFFSIAILVSVSLILTNCEQASKDSEAEKQLNREELSKRPTGTFDMDLLKPSSPFKAAGDELANVPLPVQGFGVSVAVDCDGNVYYTNNGQFNLYVMDKFGNLLNTLPTVDVSGALLDLDEMSWDSQNEVLWAQLHGSNPIEVYTVDPATGVATHAFTSASNSLGSFRDGIAYDGTDGTLWISGDVSSTVEHYKTDGTLLGAITPKDAGGATLGTISGVMVGVGDLLYLGRNGLTEIVKVKKSNGDFISSFASPGGARDEGLECDPVNFAPKLVLWSRDVNNFMSVIEIEDGTCACGGGLVLDLDIKPGDCPNTLNVNSKGVLPAAILGSNSFDVNDIDPSSVHLAGVVPMHWNTDDVTSPPVPDPNIDCECVTPETPDGFIDFTLKFKTVNVLATLGAVSPGDIVLLTVEGTLLDGTPFSASDCVTIIP